MNQQEVQQALQALAQLGAAAGNSRNSIQSVGQSMARLRTEMQKGTGSHVDYNRQLRRIVSDYESLDQSLRDSAAGQRILAEQGRVAGQILRQSLGEFAGELTKIGIAQTLDYFKNQFFTAAKSLQDNVGGTQAAFNLQNAAIESQIRTLDALQRGTETATGALASLPGWQGKLAALATGATSAFLGLEKGAKTLQKEGLQILQTELLKSEVSLKTMSASGALFTAGIQGVRRASIETQLDLAEFSKIVTNNTDLLSKLGGSVNGGILRFREVGKQMVPFRQELVKLGYSYEEQAQGQLDYMDMLNRSGKLSQTSAEDIAKGTNDYLRNLRAVSAFTGEDAKKAQARAREASTQLAVQSKLMDMGKGAMERFQSGISNMEPFMQKALQEAVAFDGTVVDKGLNQLFAMSPARQKLFEETQKDVMNQSLSAEEITKRYQQRVKELGPELAAEAKGLGSTIGAANLAVGALPELTKSLEATLQLGIKGQNAATTNIENTVKSAEKLAHTTDELTNVLARGQVVFKDFQSAVNTELTGAITKFAREGVPSLTGMLKNKGLEDQLKDSFAFTLAALKSVGLVGDNLKGSLSKLQTNFEKFTTGDSAALNDAGKLLKDAAASLKEAASRLLGSITGGGTRENRSINNRDLGTLGKTGSLFEKEDFFGKVAKGETVLTPNQLENLVRGVSGNGQQSGMQSMMQKNFDLFKNSNQKTPAKFDENIQSLVKSNSNFLANAEKTLGKASLNGVEQLASQLQKTPAVATASVTDTGQLPEAIKNAVSELVNQPNLFTNSVTELKQQISADNQIQISILKDYVDKMDTLISTMEDNVDYTKRLADNA